MSGSVSRLKLFDQSEFAEDEKPSL